MAEQMFGPGELLVVAEGDTVEFIGHVHGRAELRHDEVRKLIAFLQDIVGQGLTVGQLDALEPGDRVVDCDGDIWRRNSDGKWGCREFWTPTGPSELVNKYGPVRKVG